MSGVNSGFSEKNIFPVFDSDSFRPRSKREYLGGFEPRLAQYIVGAKPYESIDPMDS